MLVSGVTYLPFGMAAGWTAGNGASYRRTIAPDHLGSPHQITDANGVVVWLGHPDPFGNGDPTGAFGWHPKVSLPGSRRQSNGSQIRAILTD